MQRQMGAPLQAGDTFTLFSGSSLDSGPDQNGYDFRYDVCCQIGLLERINVRNIKDNKGQIRVIETILAVSIIFAAVTFVGTFAVRPASPTYETTDLEKMGYSALHDLDQQGLLSSKVYNGEWSDLRMVLKITIPVDVYFNLTVYNLDGAPLNEEKIMYGDSATFLEAKNIASVKYALVGFQAAYNPRILVLEITRGS